MESSLGSNFKSWFRHLTFLNIFTAQLRIVSPNIIRQQTILIPQKLASSSREGAKKKDVSEDRFEIATRVMLDNAFECL